MELEFLHDMKKSILIPTDFSLNALNAVFYAFDLFRDEECVFHLYHTYYLKASSRGNPLFPIPDTQEYRDAKLNVQRQMELWKNKIINFANAEKHSLYFDYEYGFFLDLIDTKAQIEQVDLIIMGTRGATDDRKIAYGRNTIDVMDKVQHCPVLGIPKNVEFQKLNEIIFPTNFKGEWNWTDLDLLLEVATITNSPIRILHVGKESALNEMQVANMKLLETQFNPCEHSFHWLQDVNLADGLLLFVKQRGSGMIAFVNRKHWFFSTIFSSTLIKDLSLHATVPILALHNAPRS